MDYNLYVKIQNNKVLDVIMPDQYGEIEEKALPDNEGWQVVKWPVNPHFTGKSGIITMIEATWPHREPAID